MSLTGPQPRDRENYELKAYGRKATAHVELCGRKLDPASSFLALERLNFPQTSFSGLEEGCESAKCCHWRNDREGRKEREFKKKIHALQH